MRKRTPAPPAKSEAWVVVATGGNDGDADACVAMLKGNRIPAMRLPLQRAMMAGFPEAIRVLVPPDKEVEARELLEEDAS